MVNRPAVQNGSLDPDAGLGLTASSSSDRPEVFVPDAGSVGTRQAMAKADAVAGDWVSYRSGPGKPVEHCQAFRRDHG